MVESNRLSAEGGNGVVGFPARAVLPGESDAEFTRLARALAHQFEPEGPVEWDAVADLGRLIWRKQRLEIFRKAAEARMTFDPASVLPKERDSIRDSLKPFFPPSPSPDPNTINKPAQDSKTRNQDLPDLHKMALDTLERNAKARRFGISDPEIQHRLLARIQELRAKADHIRGDPLDDEARARAEEEAEHLELVMMGDLLTPERYEAELRMRAQLDMAIDRSLRRLIEAKLAAAKYKQTRRVSALTPDWAKRGN
jgi:hypothetical protein